jgi:hypothetical protein
MGLYEILTIGVATVTGIFGYHKWLMSYIDERDKITNSEVLSTLKSLQDAQHALFEKLERANEKIIVLDHTAIREERVRVLLEEYRSDSKHDNIEIKTILKAITENVELLKTEAAVNKALNQRVS